MSDVEHYRAGEKDPIAKFQSEVHSSCNQCIEAVITLFETLAIDLVALSNGKHSYRCSILLMSCFLR